MSPAAISEYDRVRMVRDSRYRYLYNYMPEKPYYQSIPFRATLLPMMQEILQLQDAGKLNAAQVAWFTTKPVEELYDVEQDPYELKNLAEDPQYAGKPAELRAGER